MPHLIILAFAPLILATFLPYSSATAQDESDKDESCPQPVYSRKEVSRPAKITFKPIPGYTEEARKHQVQGRVVLSAVLCRNGQVTNISVIEGLPYGMTEQAVESTRAVRFIPAEKDGKVVSQEQRFEFQYSLY